MTARWATTLRLVRAAIGPWSLGDLLPGELRQLTVSARLLPMAANQRTMTVPCRELTARPHPRPGVRLSAAGRRPLIHVDPGARMGAVPASLTRARLPCHAGQLARASGVRSAGTLLSILRPPPMNTPSELNAVAWDIAQTLIKGF